MINKVVFFRYLPLTQKVYQDFYLQELKDGGFIVEYWYLPFVINVPEGVEAYNDVCVRVIDSYKSLNSKLKKENKNTTLFISIQTYSGNVLRLFWVMSVNNCKLAVFGKNTFPSMPVVGYFGKIHNFNLNIITRGLVSRLAFILKKIGVIRSYDVLFLAGHNGINGYGYKTDKECNESRHILVNCDDYDRALLLKGKQRIINEPFVVFLDECLPLHPDISICGIKTMDPTKYYQELNLFFDKIEIETNRKVVIAAHPKALIYKERDYFNGRVIMYGKTAELVRDADLILAHDSTAIGYVVCYDKPMLSIISKAMINDQPSNAEGTRAISNYLDTRLVVIDDYIRGKESNFILEQYYINKEKYNLYKYEYLTNQSTQDVQSSGLVVSGIRGL